MLYYSKHTNINTRVALINKSRRRILPLPLSPWRPMFRPASASEYLETRAPSRRMSRTHHHPPTLTMAMEIDVLWGRPAVLVYLVLLPFELFFFVRSRRPCGRPRCGSRYLRSLYLSCRRARGLMELSGRWLGNHRTPRKVVLRPLLVLRKGEGEPV